MASQYVQLPIPGAGGPGTFTDLTVTGNTILGDDATVDTVTLNSRFVSPLIPTVNNAVDIGSGSLKWKDGYFAGTLRGDTEIIAGALTATGNTTLGDTAASDTITLNSRFLSNLIPSVTNTNDIGSSSLKWKDGYFAGNLSVAGTVSAAGSNTQVLFNDSGVVAGDSGLVFNKTSNVLFVDTIQQISGSRSIVVSTGVLNDSTAVRAFDWENRKGYDSTGTFITIDWLNRKAYDQFNNSSIDWNNHLLTDSNDEAVCLRWQDRALQSSESNDMLLWNTTLQFPTLNTSTGTALVRGTGNQVFLLVSSARFKEEIEDAPSYEGKNLTAKSYHRIGSPDGVREVGLIAEEAAEILPEIVNSDDEGKPFSINMNAAIAVLFSRIAELEQKLEGALHGA